MRYLFPIFLFLNIMLFVKAQTTTTDLESIDKQQEWIQSILRGQAKPIKCNDYLFYCAGHHGIIWSLIASDSSGFYLCNGTTRKHIENDDYGLSDSLSFINDNIKTITWGFDSLASAAKLLKPLTNDFYNPLYVQLYVIEDNNLVLSYNSTNDYYTGSDSVKFNQNLNKLVYLMLWLAATSNRPYFPIPCDALICRTKTIDSE